MNRSSNHRSRGQPLFVFGVFAAGWIALRSLMWQSPFPTPELPVAIEPEVQDGALIEGVPVRLQSPLGSTEQFEEEGED